MSMCLDWDGKGKAGRVGGGKGGEVLEGGKGGRVGGKHSATTTRPVATLITIPPLSILTPPKHTHFPTQEQIHTLVRLRC